MTIIMDKERIMRFQMIEQEINQLNSQSEMIDQNLKEMNELKEGLEEINNKDCKEILVNIGKKIYLPVEIKSKELVVEVGNKCFVHKTADETLKIIDEQIGKLVIAKTQISERLQELENEVNDMIKQEDNHKHCSHECDCDEDCEGGKCENCECEDDECKCAD